ncbi:outer membrane beta-barrel family protein [[Flexibacter] sp. ATCC 35208]|uniref:outer membrane beta-barrel family protein n=1 Tax=[Flexibacter] sp. ATCC 35208 TaxID=1936242 RepID=UPI0009CD12A9|nr:outer membrane beta-barrel family protein [[Flexibacter] sp. ATCC 35208]OMP76201.1 hypothetical protein BW716_26345 [[Flexibacter] sp. ATCC 35208]
MFRLDTTLLLICLLCTIVYPTLAQQGTGGKISGHVKDDKNEPMNFATVVLLKQQDSALVKGAITDQTGGYQFENIPKGAYLIKISQVGYQTKFIPITTEGPNTTLETAVLSTVTKNLKEVNITAEKKLIELSGEKLIFNVSNSITSAGNNALETLRKAPGVAVSTDDQISLKGNTGVLVMINGKQSYLTGSDLADMLKSMPSSNIEAIEIVSNPSARFDAAGTAGIINIRLKKDRTRGLNGSVIVNGNYGITPKYSGSADLNYRTDKLNLYGNYNSYKGSTEITQTFDRDYSGTHYDQVGTFYFDRQQQAFKAGLDYHISNRSTIGFLINGNTSRNGTNSVSRTFIYSNAASIDSIMKATSQGPQNRNNFNYNVNYSYHDSTGKELNVDLDYVNFDRNDKSYQPNIYYDPTETTVLSSVNYRINTPANIHIYVGKTDYSQPLFKGKLGIGGKVSAVNTDNDFLFYNIEEGKNVTDSSKTNNFVYKEQVYAFYVNYNIKLSKWSIQAGLRGEQTNSRGLLKALTNVTDEDVKRSYLNFFPSASVSYAMNDAHSFNAAYSRRIGRPTYQDLNPFEKRMDELTYQKGNAFLKPQYSNSFSLSYAFRQYLIVSADYVHTRDVSAPIVETTDGNKLVYAIQNIASSDNMSLAISSNLEFFKWWNCYLNTNLYRAVYKGTIDQSALNNNTLTFMYSATNTFKLTPVTALEVSVWGRTAEVYGSFTNGAQATIDAGVSQQLWGKKATVKVACSDIFYTLGSTSSSNFNGVNLSSKIMPETRMLKLSFAYRFGSNQIKAARNRNTGSSEERNRI